MTENELLKIIADLQKQIDELKKETAIINGTMAIQGYSIDMIAEILGRK